MKSRLLPIALLVVASIVRVASARSAREAMNQCQEQFFEGKIKECIAWFDKVIA
ncbi:MAG: hypothetical protein ACKO9I_02920 [Sphaerospermopsis kisseleviana]